LSFSTQPSTTAAGASISPSVQVSIQDAGGNIVTTSNASISVSIASNPAGGLLGGTTTISPANGVATFANLSITAAGSGYTLSATSPGLASDSSATFGITPGTPTKLSFVVQPGNTTAGAAMTPAVQVAVKDAYNNTVTSSSASVSMAIAANPNGGVLAGTSSLNANAGVATFNNLSINKAGSGYTLTATSSGLASATSTNFNISPAAVSASLSTVSASPVSVPADGKSISTLTVTLVDAFGNPIVGKLVALSQNKSAHSTITPSTTTTNSSGQVLFSVTDTHKETVTYTATDTADGLTIQQIVNVTFV
jgi:hypothetical protein